MEALIESFSRTCPQDAAAAAASSSISSSTRSTPAAATLTKAAVLVGLFEHPDDHDIHVIMTVRSRRLRKHAGEVCFPGGKLDEEDGGDVVAAALREAQEEIGLDPGEVQVVGRMRPTLSLHLLEVHPVVAIIPHDFVPNPNPEEVAAVFSLPLDVVLRPPRGAHSCQDLEWFAPWRMHSFRHGEYETWGLTAETLVRLCVLAFPSHAFPYAVTHPDGLDMEGWMDRVLALPEFQAEAERVARRYGGKGKGKGKKGAKGKEEGEGSEADDGGKGEDSAEAARGRRRALKIESSS